MNYLRFQSVRAEERYIQYNVYIYSSHTNRESREKHAKDNGMRALRSEKGNAPRRKAE